MSMTTLDSRRFADAEVSARHIGTIGWGLFAEVEFRPGDVICWLRLENDPRSEVVRWRDSFAERADKSFTVVPDFAWRASAEHPFFYCNHSCAANCGFVNWGHIEASGIPIVAYRAIAPNQEITVDYSLFTPGYDSSPAGQPWSMSPCLCGAPKCRCMITDFDRLPLALQLDAILPDSQLQGRVPAHLLLGLPTLTATLRSVSPRAYKVYESALHQQLAMSGVLHSTLPKAQSRPRHKVKTAINTLPM